MTTTETNESPYERARREFDIEKFRAMTPEQAETSRRRRRNADPGDPIPEVPYEERTVRQLIYTLAKTHPAWAATTYGRSTDYDLARLVAFIAREAGYGLGSVPGVAFARHLEQIVEDYAEHQYEHDPEAIRDLNHEERAEWWAWYKAAMELPVEDRWTLLPPTFGADR